MARAIRDRDRRSGCSVVAVIKTEYREDGKETTKCGPRKYALPKRIDERSHQHRPMLASLAHGLADMRLRSASAQIKG